MRIRALSLLAFWTAASVGPVFGQGGAVAPPEAAALPAPAATAPLTLEAALAIASGRSQTLRVRRLEVERTGYATKEASARALPSFALTGSSTYMTDPPKGIKIAQGSFGMAPSPGSEFPVSFPDQDYVLVKDTEHTYFKVQASMDQVLWTWGKISAAIGIARLDEAAARSQALSEERNLVRDFSKAYFGAVLARDSLGPLREAAAIMAELVADRKSAFEVGTVTRQEVLEALSKAAELDYQAVKAEEGLATGLDALEFYLGFRPAAEDLVTPFRTALPALDEKALAESALLASTEIEGLSIKARQAALATRIRAASLAGVPDFSLNLTYDLTGQKLPIIGSNWSDSWKGNLLITLGGKVTLFDSLSSLWKLKEAEAQEAQARAGLDELTRSMGIRMRRLVEAARSGAALVAQDRAAVELSAERAKNAEVSRSNELITRSEENGARLADIAARLSLLLAAFQTESALLDIERETGSALGR